MTINAQNICHLVHLYGFIQFYSPSSDSFSRKRLIRLSLQDGGLIVLQPAPELDVFNTTMYSGANISCLSKQLYRKDNNET